MNRTLKQATVKRFHYDTHDQLRRHLDDFVNAYNFGRRLKTLKGLTPYEAICKTWDNRAKATQARPLYQMPGLNRYSPFQSKWIGMGSIYLVAEHLYPTRDSD